MPEQVTGSSVNSYLKLIPVCAYNLITASAWFAKRKKKSISSSKFESIYAFLLTTHCERFDVDDNFTVMLQIRHRCRVELLYQTL